MDLPFPWDHRRIWVDNDGSPIPLHYPSRWSCWHSPDGQFWEVGLLCRNTSWTHWWGWLSAGMLLLLVSAGWITVSVCSNWNSYLHCLVLCLCVCLSWLLLVSLPKLALGFSLDILFLSCIPLWNSLKHILHSLVRILCPRVCSLSSMIYLLFSSKYLLLLVLLLCCLSLNCSNYLTSVVLYY